MAHNQITAADPADAYSRSQSCNSCQSELSVQDSKLVSNLYKHLTCGTKDDVLSLITHPTQFNFMATEESILHFAASAGNAELITDILPECSDIIERMNSKGDLAFHSAATAGQLNALKALTNWPRYGVDKGITSYLLSYKNEDGDTALHIAVETNQEDMARCLVDQYWPACYVMNHKKVCPLYLAIKRGYSQLVKHMISLAENVESRELEALEHGLLEGKSVVHACIDARNKVILQAVLEKHGRLIESMDEAGRTPLSYAAFIGYAEGVKYLQDKFDNYTFSRDHDGSFPIHSAARGGHIEVIVQLRRTQKLLNSKVQNLLHVAAESGKSELVSHLLKMTEFHEMINRTDEKGNAPLHLAAMRFRPRVVYILASDTRVKLDIQNKDGLTALDLAHFSSRWPPTMETRLTLMALSYANAPESPPLRTIDDTETTKGVNDEEHMKAFRDRLNTQLLVATLVATVTFAAGFTLPGGYNQSEPNIGMATLAKKWAFVLFVICNTTAMYGSILVSVTLLWAQLGELKLMLMSARAAFRLLGLVLTMMSIAFMMGLFLVLSNQPWLSYTVLGMGSIFLILILLLFVPIYSSFYSRNPILRFSFLVTFLLLLKLCERRPT